MSEGKRTSIKGETVNMEKKRGNQGNSQILNTSNSEMKALKPAGNSQILNTSNTEVKAMKYPAQVIVRPFNLPYPKTTKEPLLGPLCRPKERLRYQHNVGGDFDMRTVKEHVIPESPLNIVVTGLKKNAVTRGKNQTQVSSSVNDITHVETIPGTLSNTKLHSSDSDFRIDDYGEVQLQSVTPSSTWNQVQVPVGTVFTGSQGRVINSTQGPVQVKASVEDGNLMPLCTNTRLEFVQSAMVNGQKLFLCKAAGDTPKPPTQLQIVNSAVINRPKVFVCKTFDETSSVPTPHSKLDPESSQSSELLEVPLIKENSNNTVPQNVKAVRVEIVNGKVPAGVSESSASDRKLNPMNADVSNVKSVKLTEEQLQSLLKINSAKAVPDVPNLKQIVITEEQLQKLRKVNSTVVSIKPPKEVSNKSPIVLQPLGNLGDLCPELAAKFNIPINKSQLQLQQLKNVVLEKPQMVVQPVNVFKDTLQVQLQQISSASDMPQQPVKAPMENPQVLLQQKINTSVFQRRKEIALQYQRDCERMKSQKRVARRVTQPQKTVFLTESSTQTSLFSVIEPGRFVELSFTERNSGPASKDSAKEFTTKTYPSSRKGVENMQKNGGIEMDVTEDEDSAEICEPEAPKKRKMDNTLVEKKNETPQNINRMALRNINNIHDGSSFLCDKQTTRQQCSKLSDPFCRPGNKNCDNINNFVKNISENKEEQYLQIYRDYQKSVMADDMGNIPLHNAVLDGNLQEVKRQCLVLIARRESLDWGNKDDETPLHLAVASGNLKITEELLKFRASISERDGEGNNAIHLAVGHSSNLQCLLAVLKLVEKNSDLLNAFNDEGYSPLHLCVLNSKPDDPKEKEAVLLVLKGAEVNIRDGKSGKSPLFHAVLAKNSTFSRLLVRHGASTTTPNYAGQTPLSVCEMTIFPTAERECDEIVDDPSSFSNAQQSKNSNLQYLQPAVDRKLNLYLASDVEMSEYNDISNLIGNR